MVFGLEDLAFVHEGRREDITLRLLMCDFLFEHHVDLLAIVDGKL